LRTQLQGKREIITITINKSEAAILRAQLTIAQCLPAAYCTSEDYQQAFATSGLP
jgi:hypothetical protein